MIYDLGVEESAGREREMSNKLDRWHKGLGDGNWRFMWGGYKGRAGM